MKLLNGSEREEHVGQEIVLDREDKVLETTMADIIKSSKNGKSPRMKKWMYYELVKVVWKEENLSADWKASIIYSTNQQLSLYIFGNPLKAITFLILRSGRYMRKSIPVTFVGALYWVVTTTKAGIT